MVHLDNRILFNAKKKKKKNKTKPKTSYQAMKRHGGILKAYYLVNKKPT